MIRRHLPEGQTKIANIIGEVLGREKPGIGDVWLAERIRQMLSTGSCGCSGRTGSGFTALW